ncbi:glycosyltransferase 87 family protein [Gordonia sp. HY002]|uniref:glycosyltransferase 87 family protein n=1 Tax=Gordonia zhenghanii TaxID=2911516 RepID=UPI001EEFF3F2|nr:glycosyltransferase 87 family protein [Gordonia zhenghanii]MCF8570797.1 glycosyltransferase 87 family protein [Gordonia zhenghanii]MCF8603768.1 glycosyltransferase 87 family protein [Gordonia zhenghanii]
MPSSTRVAEAVLRRWRPGPVVTVLCALAFVASSTLQIAGVPFTSSWGTRTRFDMDVYRLGGQLWHQGLSLYADGSMPFTQDGIWLPFTYPPFAALLFTPLGELSLSVTSTGVSVLTVVLLVYVTKLTLDVLGVADRANRWQIALLASAVTVWFNPFWMTLGFGQINMVLITLTMIDVFVIGRRSRVASKVQGVLVGVASAIKLTPLVFLGVFLAAGRVRAAVVGVVTFAAAAFIGWLWIPDDSVTYWTDTVFHTGRIGEPEGRINQNLNALWLRLFDDGGSTASILWVATSLLVTVPALYAVFAARPRDAFAPGPIGGRVDAMVVTCSVAVWGLLVSPTTWAHHWVWCVPAIATCLVFVSRTSDRRVRTVYGSLAGVGTVIFAIGPFQLLPPIQAGWAWWEHIVGNTYLLWGIALLFAFWWMPYRTSVDDARVPEARLDEA